MGERATTELVLAALDIAVWNRRPETGLIHHSDHGSQYGSVAFTKRLREAGIVGSMAGSGTPTITPWPRARMGAAGRSGPIKSAQEGVLAAGEVEK